MEPDIQNNENLDRIQITVFTAEAYVYKVPPATSVGHRAMNWEVNDWIEEINVKVVTSGDDMIVKMYVKSSGDLYGECPIPNDQPFQVAVDQVIDSSRYFVLRVVDKDSQKHAFIGIGFRERYEASQFNATLDDHRQMLRRQREAELQKQQYQQSETQKLEGLKDFQIKEGQSIKVNLPKFAQQRLPSSQNEKYHNLVASNEQQQGSGIAKLIAPPSFKKDNLEIQEPGLKDNSQKQQTTKKNQDQSQTNQASADDWGDFVE